MGNALGALVYKKARRDTHTHIEDCPCGELIEHDRGIDTRGNTPTQKWFDGANEAITYPIGLMDEEAMRRDHLVRMLRDVGNVEGGRK